MIPRLHRELTHLTRLVVTGVIGDDEAVHRLVQYADGAITHAQAADLIARHRGAHPAGTHRHNPED